MQGLSDVLTHPQTYVRQMLTALQHPKDRQCNASTGERHAPGADSEHA
jgi:hypothetical protein